MRTNDTNSYLKVLSFFRGIKQKLNKSALVGVIVGITFAAVSLGIYIEKNMIYQVKVRGNIVGYVKLEEEYQRALEAIKKTDGEDPLKSLSVSRVQNKNNQFMKSEEIERVAREKLELKMPGVIIYANGSEIARVESFEASNKVMDLIKDYYLKKLNTKDYKILSTNIKEKMTTYTTFMEADKIMDIDEVVQKLVNGKGVEKVYTIKKGDTIWDIAFNNGVTVEEIKASNPEVNLDKISIDQKIKLSASQPYLNVEIIADVKAIESVPFAVKNISDNKMYKGNQKVTQKGKVGSAEVEKTVTILNGNVTKEDVKKTTVITAAVEQIVRIGTKGYSKSYSNYVASSSTGAFGWPARGLISSRYGRRWGELHTGLDIALPRGSAVVASDSGVVSFSGWNGGYGYCVIINHKNGYQTLYGHNSKLYVKVGQQVSKGQKIAASGSTGRSTGPHVHFEVRKNGVAQNPQKYLN